jgi:hypothetical protein
MVEAAGQWWPDGWVKGEGFVRPPDVADPMTPPPSFDKIGEEYVRQIPYDFAFQLAWRAAMGGRPYISMGAMPLTFAVRDQHLFCPDEQQLESSVNQASPHWLDEQELAVGTVELLFLRSESGLPTRLLSFTVDDRLRGVAALPAGEPADMRAWIGMLGRRSEAAASIIRTTSDVLEMIRPISIKTTAFGEVEQSLPSRVSAMYLPWSLVHVRDAERRAQLAYVMREKGLRAVLDSVEEVRAHGGG